MELPIALQRLAYRSAYLLLRVYWLVFRPEAVGAKCVLTNGDHVLLVRHTYGPKRWELPGGSVHRREPPATAIRREMQEELGLDIPTWTPLGIITDVNQGRRDTLHCFHGELREPELVLNGAEIAAAEWFPRSALPPKLGHYVTQILAKLSS
jgi:8-oxo-dGTP pyrophosphatase MutT (NUDIX family)